MSSGEVAGSGKSIPSFSPESLKIFKEQDFALPVYAASLKRKVEHLKEIETKLEKAKKHPALDRIISLLASALAISILAGGALGTYFCVTADAGFWAAGTIASTFILSNVLGAAYNFGWSDDKKEGVLPSCGYLDGFILPIIGPFIPVFKTFGNISRYQESAEQQAKEIQSNLKKAQRFFVRNEAQANSLHALLEQEASKAQSCLAMTKKFSIKTPEAEEALKINKDRVELAKRELAAAMAFFSKN